MSTDKRKTSLPKIRTFAQDLETERAERGVAAPAKRPAHTNTSTAASKEQPRVLKPESTQTTTPRKPVVKEPAVVSSKSYVAPQPQLRKAADLQEKIGKITSGISSEPGSRPKEVRDNEYEATIITDAKHNRFSLSGSLMGSISNWFAGHKRKRAERRKQKYTVPRADRRKGIIQRATSKTARASTADYETVVQRIKEQKGDERASDNKPKPVSPVPSEVVPTIQPTTPVVPTIPVPVQKMPATPLREPITPTIPTITAPVEQPAPEVIETPSPAAIEEVAEEEETVATTEVPARSFAEVPPTRERVRNTVPRSRFLSIPIVGSLIAQPNKLAFAVLCACTLIFVTYFTVTIVLNQPVPESEVFEEGIIFSGATRYEDILIATSKETMFNQVRAHQDETTSLFEVIFTAPTTTERIPPRTILDLIEADVPADFSTNINEIVFGYYRGEPWIILRVSDKNTAYGGMLQWEKDLSNHLSPLFGPAVNSAAAGTGTAFKDGVIGTTDVRVLQSNDGRERITYGFVRSNMILITTNTTAFLNLKSNSQTQ